VANLKSQMKRNRQNVTRQERNKAVRSKVKTYVRRFNAAVEEGDREAAESAYRDAAKELDKAATKGVIHKNNAAHKKSKLAKRLAKIGA
jgi:small subunit ribosomal protein S20